MVHFELRRSSSLPSSETTPETSSIHKTRRIAKVATRIGAGTFFAAASVGFLSAAPVSAFQGDGENAIGCAVDAPIAAGLSAYFLKNRLRSKVNTGISNFGHELIEGMVEIKQEVRTTLGGRKNEIVLKENTPDVIADSAQSGEQQIEFPASETFSRQELQ